jgi:DNA-directed RNA polymerase subunit N (RpoN/RPB10)
LARHCCQRMLVGGTPRECLNACHEYMVHSL